MQLLDYSRFYTRYGIVKLSDLLNKRRFSIEEFKFARNSLVLYPGEHLDENTPLNPDELIFKNSTDKKIYVTYKFETDILLGSVTHISKQLTSFTVNFHNKHPGFKRVNTVDELAKVDNTYLCVISFSLTDESYRYNLNPLNSIYRKVNLLNTILKNANEVKNKDIYLPVTVDSIPPTVAEFIRHSKLISKKTIEIFTTFSDVLLLELWKKLSNEESVFDSLEQDKLDKLNLIFFSNVSWFVINFKTLLSFSNDSEFKADRSTDSLTLRKLLLRSLIKNISIEDEDTDVSETEIEDIDKELSELYHSDITEPEPTISNIDEELEQTDPNAEFDGEFELEAQTDYIKKFESIIESNVNVDNLTAAEYRERKALLTNITTLKDPDSNKTLLEAATTTDEELVLDKAKTLLPDSKVVPDKSMLESTLLTFDKEYINTILDKHTKAVVVSLLQAGIAVQKYETEKETSILGNFTIHRVTVKPLNGVSKLITFKLPTLNERGEFKVGGNVYRLRKQRVDLPIRKIEPGNVALSSYYGKVFVKRSEFVSADTAYYISNEILNKGFSEIEPIKEVVPGKCFNNLAKVPRIVSMLSMHISSFTTKDYVIVIDYELLSNLTEIKPLKDYHHVGIDNADNPIYVDFNNRFFVKTKEGIKDIGDIYDLANIDYTKVPDEYSVIKIFSQAIPLGVMLSYSIGFTNLIKLLKLKPRILDTNERVKLEKDEMLIRFSDFKLIFKVEDPKAKLLIAGFNYFEGILKTTPMKALDNKAIYLDLLESRKITPRFLREFDNLTAMFIDPITKDVLTQMKEPTTFIKLLFRANDLLTTDHHPDIQDIRYARIRGYERFAGFVYRELVDSYRDYNARMIKGKNSLELNPNAVLLRITTDNTKMQVSDINPIENLKQQEAITLTGEGGRSKVAINFQTRSFHETEVGVVSEATVDSGDVGVNMFLTSNPNLKNYLGMSDGFDPNRGVSSALSTSANVGVASMHDNQRRAMMHSIQNSHTVGVKQYTQNYIRTGYDSIVGSRVSSTYCVNALYDGIVSQITDKEITVTYANKEIHKYKLGTIIGSSEGSFYPHVIVTNLTLNSKFKAGDNICYNNAFFETDMLDSKKVVWKNGLFVKVGLLETPQSYEDASDISDELASLLKADTVKLRSIVLDFEQVIHKPLSIGTEVDVDSVLLMIEDGFTNRTGLFDNESIETLKLLADKSPRAKYKGSVLDVVVYYNGELEQMSASLRKLAVESNKRIKEKEGVTGQVDSEYRVDGNSLTDKTLEIKFFIRVTNSMVSGDKLVYGNQLKSVVNRTTNKIHTYDGERVDAIYGAQSIFNRIVVNPYIIGTTTTLLKFIAKKAVQMHKGV